MKIIRKTNTYATQYHFDVEAYELENGKVINCTGWNGDEWVHCWFEGEETEPDFEARPVYRFQLENLDLDEIEENSPEWDYALEIVELDLRY